MPIHDVLSQRDTRRIRRTGLSEEMNRIQREKYEQEKKRKSTEREIEHLKGMVKNLESASANPSPAMRNPSTFEPLPLPALRNAASLSANNGLPAMRNVSTYSLVSQAGNQLVETQETTPPLSDPMEPEMEDTPYASNNFNFDHNADDADAMSAVSFDDNEAFGPMEDYNYDDDDSRLTISGHQENESEELRKELSRMKSEKDMMMEAWRSLSAAQPKKNVADDNSSFELGEVHEIVNTYRKTLTQYSDAIESLNSLQSKFNEHGFTGSNALDTVNNIAQAFRDARLDLEGCAPGEPTESSNAKDWPSVLRGLVQKMQTMASQAEQKGRDLMQSEEKVTSLQGQFDEQLRRLQIAEAEIDITRNDNERLYEEKCMLATAFDEENDESDEKFQQLSVSFANESIRRIELEGNLRKYTVQLHAESEQREKEVKGLNDRITNLRSGVERAQQTIDDMKTEKSHLENELRGFKNRFSQTKVNKMYEMARMMMQNMDEWREAEPGDSVKGKNDDSQKGCTLNTGFAIGSEPITPSI